MKNLARLCLFLIVLVLAGCAGSGNNNEIRSDTEKSFAYHYSLGMASFEEKRYDEAIKHFQRSIELNPNIARTHIELGTCYMLLGKFSDSIPQFEKALSIDPRAAEAHNSLGVAFMNVGRLRDAEQQFELVLTLQDYETKYIPLYNLGTLRIGEKRFQDALDYLLQAVKDEDRISLDYRIYLHQQIGNCYFELKKYKEAFPQFDQTLVLNPSLIDVAWKAGYCAYMIGEKDRARSLLNKTISIDPGSPVAQQARDLLAILDK